VCLPRAPHPAATGGGFGFGKFRRDEQGLELVDGKLVCVPFAYDFIAVAVIGNGPDFRRAGQRR
jgi:hypothetical protein